MCGFYCHPDQEAREGKKPLFCMLETNWQVAAWQGCCIEIRGDLCKLFSRMNLFEFDSKTTTFGCGYGYISNKQQNTLVQIMKFCSKCDML